VVDLDFAFVVTNSLVGDCRGSYWELECSCCIGSQK
jgi:hypothetical protein